MRVTKRWAASATACVIAGAGCELVVGSDDYAPFPVVDAAVADVFDAPADAPPLVDAAEAAVETGPPNLGVSCGLGYCDAGEQTCCVGACSSYTRCIGRDDAGQFTCPPQSGENCGWFKVSCDDTADCPSTDQVCCSVGGHAQCLRLLDCQTQPSGHTVLCDPHAAAPCPSGATCEVRDAGRPACVGL